MSVISFMGDSGRPVACAGQTVVHRAHSVHETESSSCFHVNSLAWWEPREMSSKSASGSSISSLTCMGLTSRRLFTSVTATLTITATEWNIFVRGRMAMNKSEVMA